MPIAYQSIAIYRREISQASTRVREKTSGEKPKPVDKFSQKDLDLKLHPKVVADKMSEETNGVAPDSAERCAIGISFGNSNSSIAHTTPVSFQVLLCGRPISDLYG